MSDLAKRLRDVACGGSNWNAMLNGAADELEAKDLKINAHKRDKDLLVAEIADLRLQSISDSGEVLTAFAERDKWKSLAGEMAEALEHEVMFFCDWEPEPSCNVDAKHALNKYLEMKGNVPDTERT